MNPLELPKGLPPDRIWLPVSDQASVQEKLRLLYQAQQALPHASEQAESDQV